MKPSSNLVSKDLILVNGVLWPAGFAVSYFVAFPCHSFRELLAATANPFWNGNP